MFAKLLTRNSQGWTALQRFDTKIEKISAAIRTKNKPCPASENAFFNIFHRENCSFNNDFSRHVYTPVRFYTLEIKYAHSILQNSEAYSNSVSNALTTKHDLQDDKAQHIIDKQWSNMSSTDMLENFETLSYYASKNNESISNLKYQEIMKILTSKCSSFNNEDLFYLLNCLELWPFQSDKPMHHQMHNLMKSIDKECLRRLPNLTINEIFLINDHFYKLNFFKLSYFTTRSLQSLNLHKLTSTNLVQLMFLMKVHGKLQISISDIEHYLMKYSNEFTIEELGIIAMAYFKYETKINNQEFLKKIIQKLQNNINTVNDVTLCAFIKILRYSVYLNLIPYFNDLLETLKTQIPHRSLQIITQIAHMQASSLVHNEDIILQILDRYEKEIDQARLKDIERIAFMLYIFNYDHKKTSFWSTALKEIQNPNRTEEIKKFTKSFVYTVMYMLQMDFYDENVVKYVMDPKFINKLCNGNITKLSREYLVIDYCIEIDHPEYQGPRINNTLLDYLKKYGSFYKQPLPNDKKIDKRNQLITDIIHTCKDVLGTKLAAHIDFLLPHDTKSCIVLCYDPTTKKYIPPGEQLSQMPQGSIKYAPKDGKKWYALVIASHNFMTRNSNSPTGILIVQMRHLERIGYTPILIKYNEWPERKNEWLKKNFILKILNT